MTAATRIVLIRHGESVAQAERIVAGHGGCQGLSDEGRAQAAALAGRLKRTGELGETTVLYSSLMARSVQTAAIVAEALGGLQLSSACDFCESHPGEMDGLSWEEADRLYPPLSWEPQGRRAPGCETFAEMADRVARGLDGLVQRHAGGVAVVVCHGGVVAHSMIRWLALDPSPSLGRRARIDPVNTSITEWRVPPADSDSDEAASSVELVRYNDHAHLS